ncbi:MAG TPA: hypothetical protein VHM25_22885 [Polyangiaceae bacterium]|nr:hypothetical protein [Polyangiaceae bacterium]
MKAIRMHSRSTAALLIAAGLLPSTVGLTKPAAAAPPAAAPSAAAPADATPPAAEAPKSPAETCSAAYERTQTEKLAGHYVAASAAALECSQLQCNSAIVQECVRFYSALEQETPTLVFSARKAEGGELTDVRVEMDGKVVSEQITGRPFATDPGPHNFVFIHKKRGLLRLSETARVGDKARVLEVTFADPNAKPGAPKDGAVPAEKKGGVPVATWVLGGIGVVGLGAFTYFRLSGVSDYNRMNSENGCSPNCSPDEVDPVRNKFTYSYISLGVGAAALVGAGAFFLANRSSSGNTVQAGIAPRGDGAMAAVKTTF